MAFAVRRCGVSFAAVCCRMSLLRRCSVSVVLWSLMVACCLSCVVVC